MAGTNQVGNTRANTAPLTTGASRTTFLNPDAAGAAGPGGPADGYKTTLSGKLPALAALNPQEQAKLNSLPPQVRIRVLTQGVSSDMDAIKLKQQVVSNLEGAINDLVAGIGGKGISFSDQGGTDGATWQPTELCDMFKVVSAMPANDRKMLSGIDFARKHQVSSSDLAVAHDDMAKSKDLLSSMALDPKTASEYSMISAGFSTVASDTAKPGDDNGLVKMAKSLFHSVMKWAGMGGKDDQVSSTDGKAQVKRQVVLTDAGVFGLDHKGAGAVLAHEIGLQLQWKFGAWDGDKLAEFQKISDWKTGADGKDVSGDQSQFVTNAVGHKYSEESAFEDFAESYGTYVMDPQKLLKEAPAKFLYINAFSKKYTRDQVAGLAQMAGTNLSDVASQMLASGRFRQDTFDAIAQVDGVRPKAGGADAAPVDGSDPLAAATAAIAKGAADPGFRKALLNPPSGDTAVKAWGTKLFGNTWGQLGPDAQALLRDSSFIKRMVDDLTSGQANVQSVENEERYRLYRQVCRNVTYLLLSKGPDAVVFRQQFAQDPVKALQQRGLWDNLPPTMKKALQDKSNAPKFAQFIQNLDANQVNVSDAELNAKIDKYVQALSVSTFQSDFDSTVVNDPDWAKKAANDFESVKQTGQPLPGEQGDPFG